MHFVEHQRLLRGALREINELFRGICLTDAVNEAAKHALLRQALGSESELMLRRADLTAAPSLLSPSQ